MSEVNVEVTEESSTTDSDSVQSTSDSSEVVESTETESTDTESTDTESTDTESTDTESTDTESTDSESIDTESTDTESTDTESTDSESTDTESSNTDSEESSEDSESGDSDTSELDVSSLNILSASYSESLLSVTPTTSDYYYFIESPLLEYFEGIMANYPLNDYVAYHLRHYVSSSTYYSYYDDYYYLFYDYPDTVCVEIYKAHDSNVYTVTWGSGEILDSDITYGSVETYSDLRGGFSYVQSSALLCVVACACILYVVHAFFKHLCS